MRRNKHAHEKQILSIEEIRTKMIMQYVDTSLKFNSTSRNFRFSVLYKYIKDIYIPNTGIYMLPKDFGTLPHLEQLDLSDNNLGVYGDYNWSWLEQIVINKNLLLLDLSRNLLTKLPTQVTKLDMLTTLNVCHNNLTYLPQSIRNLKCLAILDATDNKLSYLPGSICKMFLCFIDVTHNPFNKQIRCSCDLNIPSLVELSARVVINQRIAYDRVVLPRTLIEYLDKVTYCSYCGSACIDFYMREFIDCIPYEALAHIVNCGINKLPVECYYCSSNCCKQYRRQFCS